MREHPDEWIRLELISNHINELDELSKSGFIELNGKVARLTKHGKDTLLVLEQQSDYP